MTANADSRPAGRFWRGKKLGSQDFSLQDRGSGNSAEGDADGSVANGTSTEYRTYKRRWFGLVQLTLMNIVVSWDVCFSFFEEYCNAVEMLTRKISGLPMLLLRISLPNTMASLLPPSIGLAPPSSSPSSLYFL